MSPSKPWLVIEKHGGACLVARFQTRGEAEMHAKTLRRGMRILGDGREYVVREVRA